MADIQVANTDADLSGNTVVTEENTYTITGLHTYSRGSNAPFACITGSAYVQYLDADKVDGVEAAALLRVDGSLALSANWDAGGYEIRSNTFESDVATGTSPLVVASTTKVANLNADLLDDQTGSYYLDVANITGTTLPSGIVTSSLTTVGTIATGVWNGTSIGTGYTDAKVTSVVAGTAVDVSGATGDVTVNVDLSELSTSTTDGDGDYFVVVDTADAQKKLTKANISIGGFNTAVATSITATGTIASGVWNGTAVADAYVANDLTISGGTVNNSIIGGSTAAAGSFTTLNASDTATVTAVNASSTLTLNNTQWQRWKDSGGTARNIIRVSDADVTEIHPAGSGDPIYFVNFAGTVNNVAFLDNGNVGIGTTAPGTAVAATNLVHSINCVRAWGVVTQTSGGATLNAGFNCSVGRDSIGDTDVTLTPWAAHSNDYCVVVTIIGNTHSQTAYAYNHGTGGFKILCYNGTSLADLKYSFTVIGD